MQHRRRYRSVLMTNEKPEHTDLSCKSATQTGSIPRLYVTVGAAAHQAGLKEASFGNQHKPYCHLHNNLLQQSICRDIRSQLTSGRLLCDCLQPRVGLDAAQEAVVLAVKELKHAARQQAEWSASVPRPQRDRVAAWLWPVIYV
jgi:hypothetical protein